MHTHTHVHMHMHMHMHTRTSQVRYERDGASRELRYCDYFGEVSMLTQTSHLATATATSEFVQCEPVFLEDYACEVWLRMAMVWAEEWAMGMRHYGPGRLV